LFRESLEAEALTYTQPPSMSREDAESLLREAKIARFCSLNKDGTIHAAPVWFKYENGEIIVATAVESHKARNVRRNSNVTILVDISEGGIQPRCALIYGKAEVGLWTEERFREGVSLLERYMPKERAEPYARGLFKLTKWQIMRIRPERIASFDYSKDDAYWNATKE
jgi:nitroimidazol reductase NimA-like FMN-containing flavoprotein (pyridoxamine 5'-phosphate oxidase superfamily)